MIGPGQGAAPRAAPGPRGGAAARAIARAIALLLGGAMLYLVSDTVADPDLWGHLRFGRDILESGRIARADPYSYLSGGRRWINHEWLAEVLFALAYGAGGAPGLVALKTSVGMATLGLVWWHAARRGLGRIEAGLFTLVVTGPAVPWMLAVRPQVVTYLFFAVVLVALARAGDGRRRGLAVLPAVFAAWANLHGGFLAGLAVLFAWVAARVIRHTPPRREAAALLVVALGSLGAVLLNPYGAGLPSFLLRTATGPRPEIDDWRPLRPVSLEGLPVLGIVALAVVLIAISRGRRDGPALLVLAACVVGPFVAHRHVPLALLAVAVVTADHAADLRARFAPPVEDPPARRAWATAALIAALGLALVAASASHFARIRLTPPAPRVPAGAVAVLKAAGVRGNLAVPFTWGEYVIWHLGPAVKVSVDGRRETVYSEEVYRENLRFLGGQDGWDDLIRRPETELVLTGRAFACDRLMGGRPGWVAVYEDDLGRLFARAGSAAADALRRAGPPVAPARAFPG